MRWSDLTVAEADRAGGHYAEIRCARESCRSWMRALAPEHGFTNDLASRYGPDAKLGEIREQCGWCAAEGARIVRVVRRNPRSRESA